MRRADPSRAHGNPGSSVAAVSPTVTAVLTLSIPAFIRAYCGDVRPKRVRDALFAVADKLSVSPRPEFAGAIVADLVEAPHRPLRYVDPMGELVTLWLGAADLAAQAIFARLAGLGIVPSPLGYSALSKRTKVRLLRSGLAQRGPVTRECLVEIIHEGGVAGLRGSLGPGVAVDRAVAELLQWSRHPDYRFNVGELATEARALEAQLRGMRSRLWSVRADLRLARACPPPRPPGRNVGGWGRPAGG